MYLTSFFLVCKCSFNCVVNDVHSFPDLSTMVIQIFKISQLFLKPQILAMRKLHIDAKLYANHIFICFPVSTVSVPRSAKFCSCSVCARSSMVCLSSWTRPQSTCSGLLSLTLLGGKAAITQTWCHLPVEAKVTTKLIIIVYHTENLKFIKDAVMVRWLILSLVTVFYVWNVVNDAELFSPSYRPWWMKTETKPVWSETTFNDSNG